MRFLALSALLIGSVCAQDRPAFQPKFRAVFDGGAARTVGTSPAVPIDFVAGNIQRDATVLRLKGNAVVNFGDQTVEADEIDYHWNN